MGTLITEGKLGDGFFSGLITVAVIIAVVALLAIRSNAKMTKESCRKIINSKGRYL